MRNNYLISKTTTAGPGTDSVLVDRHVTCAASRAWSQRPTLLQAAAETTAGGSTGKEYLKADRRVRHYKTWGWSARMATRWSSHGPECSLRYRSLHVSSSANDSFKTFTRTGARSRQPHHSHFSHGRQNRRSSFLPLTHGSGRGENLVTIARFVKPLFGRSCCSWGPAEAKRCMPAPRHLHWMASVMVMWSTLSSHSEDATFRRPNGFFSICTLR